MVIFHSYVKLPESSSYCLDDDGKLTQQQDFLDPTKSDNSHWQQNLFSKVDWSVFKLFCMQAVSNRCGKKKLLPVEQQSGKTLVLPKVKSTHAHHVSCFQWHSNQVWHVIAPNDLQSVYNFMYSRFFSVDGPWMLTSGISRGKCQRSC